jgi:hypothetical protein
MVMKITQLGRTQLLEDVQLFWHSLFHAKRAAGIRAKLERERREMAEAAIELQLDDAASALQLPQNHPLVIASVIFHAQRNAARNEAQGETEAQNYPHYLGGDW